jgi:hypothetical protein
MKDDGGRGLHVETLRRALVLPVEHVLLGLLEVLVVHLNRRYHINFSFIFKHPDLQPLFRLSCSVRNFSLRTRSLFVDDLCIDNIL